MQLRAWSVLICLLIGLIGFAQTDSAATKTLPHATQSKPKPAPFVFKPTLGLGTGMFSFYGDLYEKHLVNPQVSRVGFELSLSQPITPWLRLGFYSLFGKLGANERLITRNLNFESQIRVGGLHLEYNFDNFLKQDRLVSPYLSLGFESFEFLTKTDLFDANGNRYHYWSDGSIRNLDENHPFAFQASIIQRDYTYETDVREQNLDGFGKYPERSFAVPIGAGFLMHLNDKWDAKIGTTFHFTFTDYLDGVTADSQGERKGNAKNDHYVMTSFSIRYNLTGPNQTNDTIENPYEEDDVYAVDLWDYDQDGVQDLVDSCGGTPPGVAVDRYGCPIDSDGDLTADFRDREQATSAGMITDEYGIGLSDSVIQRRYEMYMDSTGKFTETVVLYSGKYSGPPPVAQKIYMVSLGKYGNGVSNDEMAKFLSIPDINTSLLSDSVTLYTAGKYTDLRDAEKRRRKLVEAGIANATLVYKTPDGKFVEVKDIFTNGQGDPIAGGNPNNGNTTNGGANSTNTTNGNTTNGGTNSTNTTNGNTTNGGANSTNTTNGNTTNGGTNTNNTTNIAAGNNGNGTNSSTNPAWMEAGPNDNQVVFRVQLGAFRNRISRNVFYDVPDLVEIKTSNDGLYKYTTGAFTSFDAAAQHQANMLVKGYRGAFIVAYKNGKRIPLSEAGVQSISNPPNTNEPPQTSEAVSANLVTFKVQLGVFKALPPEEIQQKLNALSNVEKAATAAGLTRYTVGNTSDYKTITALRDEMKAKGFPDAFVIAFFKGESISVQEALDLLSE